MSTLQATTSALTPKGTFEYAVGRRKTANARVRYYKKGEGKIIVNGKDAKEYFPASVMMIVTQALSYVTEPMPGDFSIKVVGSGKHSQAEAVRHGMSRIIVQLQPEAKTNLKKAGLLTRDPRKKERKKPGLRRARRSPQWSKR